MIVYEECNVTLLATLQFSSPNDKTSRTKVENFFIKAMKLAKKEGLEPLPESRVAVVEHNPRVDVSKMTDTEIESAIKENGKALGSRLYYTSSEILKAINNRDRLVAYFDRNTKTVRAYLK